MGEERWSPGFVDYLFLAFNTTLLFANRLTGTLSLGEVVDDGPAAHFTRNGSSAGSESGKHHLAWVPNRDAAIRFPLPSVPSGFQYDST